MFATPISRRAQFAQREGRAHIGHRPQGIFSHLAIAGIFICLSTLAAETSPAPASTVIDAAARKKVYLEARSRFLAQTNNTEFGWQFARACFDRAVAATNNVDRAKFADEGIAASRQVVARDSAVTQAHYYLGMNLGQLADTKRNTGALRIVDEMEREFKTARDLDEHYDNAGPDRNLGLLYWQAPALVSIGSRTKARQHLRRAAEVAPDYPENRLILIEAYLKWGDRSGAWRELKALEGLLPEARQKLTGDAWANSWSEWDRRLALVKKKLPDEVVTVESPKAQKMDASSE